jgi:hypothetical protein
VEWRCARSLHGASASGLVAWRKAGMLQGPACNRLSGSLCRRVFVWGCIPSEKMVAVNVGFVAVDHGKVATFKDQMAPWVAIIHAPLESSVQERIPVASA